MRIRVANATESAGLFVGGIYGDMVQMIMSFKNEEAGEFVTLGNFLLTAVQRKRVRVLGILCDRSAQFAPNPFRQQAGKVEGR